MPRRDEIDAVLAKHFAWSFVPPEQTAEVEERLHQAEAAAAADAPKTATATGAVAPGPGPKDERALEEFRARSSAACKPAALATAEAWAEVDDAKRFLAVKRLLARAHRLGVEVVGMQEWPVESVRLLRLLLRYSPRMTRRQRERAAAVFSLMPLDDPETADL